jgi:SWI/SNF-related matrix-associated actin-dependent regulator of chromatin subfamily A member 5
MQSNHDTRSRSRVARVRQDIKTASPFERRMNDHSANELYEQLYLAAIRAGKDPNAPEPPIVHEGYAPPVLDPTKYARVAQEERRRINRHYRDRQEFLNALRANPEHTAKDPFNRILQETEYWCGVSTWSSTPSPRAPVTPSPSLKKQPSHRSRVEHDHVDECSQGDAPMVLHMAESPPYIRGTLRPYQIEGVNWLLGLFGKCINGILADEMGLGKTFQTIAALAYLKFTHGFAGPHLIICPKSVLGNWFREFKQWCPSFKVFKFHGPTDLRPSLVKAHLLPFHNIRYDVVVTTYEMAIEEQGNLRKIPWHYLVVDEAHKLKNEETKLHTALAQIQVLFRLIITGTPLQNNLRELWALLHFLAPPLFDDSDAFDSWFDLVKGEQDTAAVTSMHKILAPLMLRRLKADVNTGIPPKREIYVTCQLSRKQREWYTTVIVKDADVLNKVSGGSATRLNNILMQLRKIVDHPYLMPGGEDGPPFKTDEWIVKHSGKMIVLDALLRKLKNDAEADHKVLIFSQMTRMLDVLEDYCIMRGFKYCRIDGSTSGLDRDLQMAQFNAPRSEYFIFLLSTRSGGVGINLQAANHVILYDSDWNPQMDLQAQDRAHRIGQKRSVRVYRFIVDGTLEELIYRRALKRLYLDAMVVQQGRIQQSQSGSASNEELLAMIKFGANEIFKARHGDVTEADIDRLLSEGEEKQETLDHEIRQITQNSLASFKFGAEESNLYDFEGIRYRGTMETKLLHITLEQPISQEELLAKCSAFGEVLKCALHPNLKEALVSFKTQIGATDCKKRLGLPCEFAQRQGQTIVTKDMIDECLIGGHEELGRGKRVPEAVKLYTQEDISKIQEKRAKGPPLKLPKPPKYRPHQLFNTKRLREIFDMEIALLVKNWRMKYDQPSKKTKPNGVAAAEDDDADEESAANQIEEEQLPSEVQTEKESLLAEAFTSWSVYEFHRLVSILCAGDVDAKDYAKIAERLASPGKTEGAVRDYLAALWERGPIEIPNFQRIEERIMKAQKKVEAAKAALAAAKWKMESCETHEDLKFLVKSKDADMDRALFLAAYDAKLNTSHVREVVLQLPHIQFDIYYQSRSEWFFQSRVKTLIHSVRREYERPNGIEGGYIGRSRKKPRVEKKMESGEPPKEPVVLENGAAYAE